MQARTVPLSSETTPDLLAAAGEDGFVFAREGVGVAGRGEAMRIDLPRGLAAEDAAADVLDRLRAISTDDRVQRPGTGPVAIAALPFDANAPASLVVPEVLVGRAADGTSWITTIGEGPLPEPHVPTAPGTLPRSPDGFILTSCRPHAEWCALIDDAVTAIRDGQLEKVVLAREVVVEANLPIVIPAVLERLRALYPACVVFSVDGFVGATPELLVSRLEGEVRSHPLAGTVARSGDPAADARLTNALLESEKERHEHRVVIDAIVDALAPICTDLEVPESPSIVALRNVSHLGTLIRGRIADDGEHGAARSSLGLARALHPTPAVGGTPTDAALAYLAKAEGFDRGRYAGPVGWMDARGDGQWAVGIRSAEIDGRRARLFAGVGVVADSDPDAELAETQLKLQALLAAVVRP